MTLSEVVVTRKPRYWFAAKRYGWGWGLPLTWQGWAVLGVFAVLLCAGALILQPRKGPAFSIYVVGASAALVLVCYLKGEPPRWRWGK
jgi:hypothetical protein